MLRLQSKYLHGGGPPWVIYEAQRTWTKLKAQLVLHAHLDTLSVPTSRARRLLFEDASFAEHMHRPLSLTICKLNPRALKLGKTDPRAKAMD